MYKCTLPTVMSFTKSSMLPDTDLHAFDFLLANYFS